MLVLTRRLSQSICVGADVIVAVVDIKPHKVRLGVSAPRSVPVHREEVHAAIQRGEIYLPPCGPQQRRSES